MEFTDDLSSSQPSREELVARLQLMETMVAEGRQATGRYGWIFVLWGLVDITGVLLQPAMHYAFWVWPVVLGVGTVLQIIGFKLFCARGRTAQTMKSRALSAIWQVMGVTLALYCLTGMFTHHAGGSAYLAAIFMVIGMTHGVSAIILRWPVQGVVSALWLAGGVACYIVPPDWLIYLFVGEMGFGMVLFGLYAMLLEGRRGGGAAAHA